MNVQFDMHCPTHIRADPYKTNCWHWKCYGSLQCLLCLILLWFCLFKFRTYHQWQIQILALASIPVEFLPSQSNQLRSRLAHRLLWSRLLSRRFSDLMWEASRHSSRHLWMTLVFETTASLFQLGSPRSEQTYIHNIPPLLPWHLCQLFLTISSLIHCVGVFAHQSGTERPFESDGSTTRTKGCAH